MAWIPVVLMVLFYGSILVALIYLIIQRIEEKRHENFEKRDN